MKKAGFTVARVIFGVLAASMLAVAMLAASAAGSANAATCTGKCFALTVSPTNPTAGASGSFTFTITNEASPQSLGSVQISAPAGFVITGASAASGMVSFTSSSALFIDLNGGQGLAPGATTTLTVTAAATCGSGMYQWGIAAKQSNDFSGTGNAFLLDPASAGNLSGSVTGSCSLAFTADGEPASTAAGAVITSKYNSTGGPVKVEVLDGSGQLDTSSTAAVTVAIQSNPNSGSLSGTLTVNASGGTASFSDLSIDRPGNPYTLTATSPGITPATPSTSFMILGSVQPCSTSCSASSSTTTTSATVTTTSAIPAGDSLGFSLGGVRFTCNANYQQVSDAVSFDVFNSSGVPLPSAQFTVSLEIFKSAVDSSGRTGASQWQICYASQQPFTAQPGTSGTTMIGGVSYNTGLLADCSSTQGAPCVQDRHKDNAGDVVIDFLATGDPVGWG
jgi:Domain of unknown function DUF11